jgi:hypothetical protein
MPFLPLIIIVFNLFYNVKKKRLKLCLKVFIFFIAFCYFIVSIIAHIIELKIGKIDKGRFEDFYNIFNLPPIKSIELSQSGYILGKIKYSDEKNSYTNNLNLFTWEGNRFYVERSNNKYKYLFMLNYNKNDKKQCGIDYMGNKLYLPNSINCPINYLEITENKEPSFKEYSFKTLLLDSNKYLHYTNEFINNQILFDLKISDEILPYSSTNSYNSLCYSIYIYSYKYCNYGKNYYDFENKSGYSLIDKELLNKLIKDNNLPDINNVEEFNYKYSYLYNRTYSALEYNSKVKNIKLYNFNLISKYINLIYILFLTFFVFFFLLDFVIQKNVFK